MRLIDAEAFFEDEFKRCGDFPLVGTCSKDNEYLGNRLSVAPTIEAKPVVHAHWQKYDDSEFCYCSYCGKPAAEDSDVEWHGYCPICGAQMDELVSNTDELKCSVKIPVISMEDVSKIMEEKE